MKQVLTFIAIAAVSSVAVVGMSNKKANTKKVNEQELAQFQEWKDANEKTGKSVAANHSSKRTVNYQSPKMVSESQNAAKTTQTAKRGWSKSAKGAVIGGASGAVLGAVINKRNRAAGAVIGGVLGAGAGYGIGRKMDKKDGRINLAGI